MDVLNWAREQERRLLEQLEPKPMPKRKTRGKKDNRIKTEMSRLLSTVAAKDAEIAALKQELSACTESPGGCGYWREAAKLREQERDNFHDFILWLSQRHEHDGLSKGQIIRMAARMDVGGKWQDDHVKFDGRTAIEVLDAEIVALRAQLEKADALAESMIRECESCETPCGDYVLARLYKEARHG